MEATENTAGGQIMADLQNLTQDAEELLKATAGDASDKAREARSRMAAAVQRAKASYLHLQEQTVAGAKAAAKKADVVIRDHPYESIGIAFGLGLLIGVLVTRK